MKSANNQDFPEFNINVLTEEDFLNDEKPFEYLYSLKTDPFYQSQELEKISRFASKEFGIRNVKSMFENYEKTMDDRALRIVGVTDFKNQPLQLNLKNWQTDGWRIFKVNRFNEMDIACTHPILPYERIRNVDTGQEKIKLAYYKPDTGWQFLVFDKDIVSSQTKIVSLSNYGISVSSETARHLVRYLQETEAANYDRIKTVKSASRVGWVNGSFLPYDTEIEFDGELSFRSLYDAIQSVGEWDAWLEMAQRFRRTSSVSRIALAASFASPLLQIINSLPFFTHLWGSESATGKTVIAMVAASVWGNPDGGAYMQTFNSTEVASEKTASFLNSMPLVMDELQTSRKYRGKSTFSVYKLAQGTGRARGTKEGGIDQTTDWKLTVITTGESPLVDDSEGAGAHARVIDVEVNNRIFTVEQGKEIVSIIRENYGMAGRKMVEAIQKIGKEKINKRYDEILTDVRKSKDVQDKQAMAAAVLLLADEIADEHIFQDDQGRLGFGDLESCLVSAKQISVEERAMSLIENFIAANAYRFKDNPDYETYGKIEDGVTYIIRSKFNELMADNGFSDRTVLSAMSRKGLLLTEDYGGPRRNDVRAYINGTRCRCVAIRDVDTGTQTELPFE